MTHVRVCGGRIGFTSVCISMLLLLVACGGGSSTNNHGGGTGGGGSVTVSAVAISPKHAELVTSGQAQQFTATVTGDSQSRVTWSVDGIDGGSAAVGTVSSTGLYTSPANPGTHTVKATSALDYTKSVSVTGAITDFSRRSLNLC
jgi:hypothetical protein